MLNAESNMEKIQRVSLGKKIGKVNSLLPMQSQWGVYRIALIVMDIFMVNVAFQLAYTLRFNVPYFTFFNQTVEVSPEYYLNFVATASIIWLVNFALNGLYSKQNLLGGTREYSLVFRSSTFGFMLIVIAGFLQASLLIARGWLLMAWVFTFMFVAIGRFILRRVIYFLRRQGFFLTPAVIVGANQEGRWLAEQLQKWETSGLHIVGFVDKKVAVTTPLYNNLINLGTVDQLGEIIEQFRIGEVILASSAISTRDYLMEIFKKYGVSDKVNLRMSSGLYEVITTGMTVDEFAYVPLMQVHKVRLTGTDIVLKTVLDYVLSFVGLVIISPLFLSIAAAVKLTSPGPIFHKRRVMGLNGKQFDALKFRSMVVNGDEVLEQHPELQEELAQNHKLKNDPRITSIGVFLRKYSLDELPQLINVLRGGMSLVGPRMISPEEVAMYKQFDMNLLTVKPGMTGLWQVSGRSDVSYDERVRMDMYYIRNWSIWLDLQILTQTIPVVFKGRGAY
ncbi:MAG: sugar transferase [Anaerolineales bacterium]|nr:MAG: sugar transferase [Anaerolineales bacterium]